MPALLLLAASAVQAQVPNTLHNTLLSPSTAPQAVASFGFSVATNGTVFVAGTPFADTTVADAGQAYVFDAATGALLHTLNNPDPGAGDQFGYAMAISGNLVVVGAMLDDLPAAQNDKGSVYVFDLASATPTVPAFAIHNPLTAPGAQRAFGRAVAISGTRIAVGACGVNSSDTGAAYIYDVSSATPTTPLVTLPAEASSDNFGNAVAIEGTRVVVGAPRNNNGAADAGSAYMYEISSATPTVPTFTFRNPAAAATDFFGYSVALLGTRVVVSAALDDAGAADAGSVYVFDTAGATPTVPVHTLPNPAPAPSEAFGLGVAISGNTLVVGASFDAVGASAEAGTTFIYDLNGATPTQPVLTLENPSPLGSEDVSDGFGFAVAISGTRVLVGAYQEDIAGQASRVGIAYGYDLAGATPPVPVVTMNSPAVKPGDLFGSTVAVSGTRAVVGAANGVFTGTGHAFAYDLSGPAPVATFLPNPRTSNAFASAVAISGSRVVAGAYIDSFAPTGNGAGIVYIFDLAGTTPGTPALQLNNPAPATSDFFGYAVAISGNRVVVGAHQDDTGGTNTGTAYVYDLTSGTPTVPVFTLNNPTPVDNDNFGIAVAIDGTRVVVGATGDDTGATDAGSAYVFDLSSGTPTVPITLNNPAPLDGDKFGNAVIVSGTRVAVAAALDDAGAADAGTVYAYDMTAGPSPAATLLNPAPAANDQFGASLAVAAGTLLVGAPLDDATATDGGTAYVFDIGGATPSVALATLDNPTPATGDKFASSAGISGTIGILGAPNDDTLLLDKGAAYIYGLERPEIAVSQPAATNIVDGGTKNCGNVRIGEPSSFVFTLRNTGTSDLSGISLTKNGAHATDFNITATPPELVGPGGSTTFTVQYNPTGSGTRTAALHIASNDFDENPFDINLIGLAFSVTEDFDGDGMNDWAEFQLAAQGFDWRLSQPALVSGFYAGANSAGLFTQSQLEAIHVTPLLSRDPGTGQFKVIIGLEKSSDLVNFAPFPLSVPQTSINAEGKLEFLFTVPGNAAFFKVENN